jgi:hypothetical protein
MISMFAGSSQGHSASASAVLCVDRAEDFTLRFGA